MHLNILSMRHEFPTKYAVTEKCQWFSLLSSEEKILKNAKNIEQRQKLIISEIDPKMGE